MNKNEIIKSIVVTLVIIVVCIFTLCISKGTFAQKNIISEMWKVTTSDGDNYCKMFINDEWHNVEYNFCNEYKVGDNFME